MRFDRELLIRLGIKSGSFDELAEKVGFRGVIERFVEEVSRVVPGMEYLFARYEALRDRNAAHWSADMEEVREAQLRYMSATNSIISCGLSSALLSSPAKVRVPKVLKKAVLEEAVQLQKVKKDKVATEFEAVAEELIESVPMRACVAGYAGTFHGRPVVRVFMKAGLFGEGVVEVDAQEPKLYTLYNGIINHSECKNVHGVDLPTTYWLVIDEASKQKHGFTRDSVVAGCLKRAGQRWKKILKLDGSRRYLSLDSYRQALGVAFDVVKTHYLHPTKRSCGMSHMFGSVKVDGEVKLMIYGRRSSETLQHFEELRDKLAKNRETQVPLASHDVRSV